MGNAYLVCFMVPYILYVILGREAATLAPDASAGENLPGKWETLRCVQGDIIEVEQL